jgi:hypothetical protein
MAVARFSQIEIYFGFIPKKFSVSPPESRLPAGYSVV